MAPEFAAKQCVIAGISFDAPSANKAFAEKFEFPYALLSDVDRTVGAAYGAKKADDQPIPDFARRVSFLIDPHGLVAKVYEVKGTAGHAAEVLADLEGFSSDG
jgi:peroxiredoxin Q/BCP